MKALYDWMIHWASTPYSVYALFLISFAESSFFPLPPDLLLIPMCLGNPKQSFFYATVCTIASVLGGVLGVFIGKKGGRPVIQKLFDEKKVAWAENLYQKYDGWAIGIAGFTPIPYKVFTILAGALKVNLKTVVFVSTISRGARFFMIAGLIYYFGKPIQSFIDKYFNLLTIGFVVLLFGGFIVVRLLSRGYKPVKID